MGCWVVPAVAAELWGMPLDRVMEAIQNGVLFWKNEDGFLLIDADPRGAASIRGSTAKQPHPPTYTPAISTAEMNALLGEAHPQPEVAAAPALTSSVDEDPAQFDWRPARQRAATLRRPPRTH
jgi:hypothetical protein